MRVLLRVAQVPNWVPPSEPRPIGFMRGTAPVLIIDVSGTMNPRQVRGQPPASRPCHHLNVDVDWEGCVVLLQAFLYFSCHDPSQHLRT